MKTRTKNNQSLAFIELAFDALYKKDLIDPPFSFNFRREMSRDRRLHSVESIRNYILDLECYAQKRVRDEGLKVDVQDNTVDVRYPIYSEIIEVAPIYKEAVSLECHRPLVLPSEITTLLYLTKIPSFPAGVVTENHGFGYHFHYGKMKSDRLERTRLLFTFDSNSPAASLTKQSKDVLAPLYFEYHAEGKYKSIDVESIGLNKRIPIYHVCLDIGVNRGLKNFKVPGNESGVFYDARTKSA